jgi:hypothetical protein
MEVLDMTINCLPPGADPKPANLSSYETYKKSPKSL